MGDIRFDVHYERLQSAADRAAVLRGMKDDEVVAALASAGGARDRYLSNVLATEAQNRMLHAGRAIEHVSEGLLIVDTEDRIVRANARAAAMLGVASDTLVGTPISAWFVRPREADDVLAEARTSRESVERGGVFLLARHRTLAAMVTASPIMREETHLGTVVSFVDLSARLAEDRRRGLGAVVTRILADQVVLSEAAPRVLAAIGERVGWSAGALWIVVGGERRQLHCAEYWASDERARSFKRVTEDLRVEPGQTLPGRAWTSARPLWLEDLQREGWFVRAEGAQAAGLTTAFAVPIRASGRVVGVFEFFHRDQLSVDLELIETMEVVAGLLGQFVERSRLAGQTALLAALLDSMEEPTIIVESSCVIATLDRRAAAALGRPRAGLAGESLERWLSLEGGRGVAEALAPVFAGDSVGTLEGRPAAAEAAATSMELTARPIREIDGRVVGAVLTVHAIGARRTEARAAVPP